MSAGGDCETVLAACEDVRRIHGKGEGKRVAVEGITLSVRRGEVLLVWGPSGSGKTTLLRILGGLDTGYEGRVRLLGEDPARISDRALSKLRGQKIGFVFQAFHLLGHLTARENVLSSTWFGPTDDQAARRADELLDWVGLGDRARAKPPELSGGQRQRLVLARALLHRPELLLCDEPTGQLDSVTGEQVIDLFQRVNREFGTTLVIVTHEERLRRVASRSIALRDGRLVSESEAHE